MTGNIEIAGLSSAVHKCLPFEKHKELMVKREDTVEVALQNPMYTGPGWFNKSRAARTFTVVDSNGLAGLMGLSLVAYTRTCEEGPS